MKKTYMIPTLKVVKIQPAQILAGSEQIKIGSKYSGGETLSRHGRFSRWEEEDFESEE